jgi:hypothetical protein
MLNQKNIKRKGKKNKSQVKAMTNLADISHLISNYTIIWVLFVICRPSKSSWVGKMGKVGYY